MLATGRSLLSLAAALAVAVPAFSQAQPAKSKSLPGEYSIIEFNPFVGYQWFQVYARENNRVSKLDAGPTFGFRITEDLWKYVGIEESLSVGFNDLRIKPFGLNSFVGTDARNFTLAINPVLHFTPRQSKFRPFVTVGPAVTWYSPDKAINTSVVPGAIPPNAIPQRKYGPAMIYGGGIKYNITRSFGLRFDLRGLWTQGRQFELPDYPPAGVGSVYIPKHGSENGLAATGGVTFRFGHRTDEVPAPVVVPKVEPPKPNITISGITGARDVCPGENLRLEVGASGWLPDQTPTYQWMVNGTPVSGANGSSFSVPTVDGAGNKSITVSVSVPGDSKTSQAVNVRVKEYSNPTVQFPLSPSTVAFGTKVPLAAQARASECGGTANLRYSASEGSVSGGTFDTSTLAFDPSNRLKQQTKVVHLTATATDSKGGTGTASADLTVTLSPEAKRLDDIVFPNLSSRVNNCAKRVLLEQLTPMLRDDPNATVILIGHRDEREKGKAASKLDRTRVLNSAAVLSAGTGICPQLELSRVKVKYAGTDQSSPAHPNLCGESTNVKEKSGQAIRAKDQRAQFRRVEVWIVPGGAPMPEGVSGLEDAPKTEVQKLKCPK